MNHPEQEFWNRLKPNLPFFTQRIETSTGMGIPDVYCCYKGKPFWLELKVWIDGTGILLRKEQWGWANRHKASGGVSFVVTQTPIDNVVLLMPIESIIVSPYGTQEKYVLITSKQSRDTAIRRSKIKEPLIKYLFP